MTYNEKTSVKEAKKIFAKHDTNISHITNITKTLEKEGENGWAVKLKAHSILVGEKKSPKDVLDLNKELKNYRAFGFSRKILSKISEDLDPKLDLDTKIKIIQQHALCTYKDPDITINKRFDDAETVLIQAFEILDKEEKKKKKELTTWHFQETYGIAGAINKYRWESDGRKENLERSLNFYNKGYELGPKTDYGYTGINYAYVLDYLAYLEFNELSDKDNLTDSIETKLEEANSIRNDLIKVLPTIPKLKGKSWLNDEWWYFATIAEAYFGVQEYKEALACLKDAKKAKKVAPWEKETTVKQLANIARINHEINQTKTKLEDTEAWKTLEEFVGKADIAGVRTAFLGKTGLALSGGGFRASLFHIGVLAKLAEMDMLRHIEVLSCVSGGSIIGAHYYLEIRKLLQEKTDSKITQQDYIDIVKRIEKDFLDGVQENIRTRVVSEFFTNLKMIHKPNYSRTNRGGELYEKHLYSKVNDNEGDSDRWINDLFINPKKDDNKNKDNTSFNPKYDNWTRSNKVPILVINATTLNTGHNWQFTASFMGEPPTYINTEIDDIYRLRRMYYWEAPEKYNEYRLGYAVAASSAVPGVFEPIPLEDLYPGKKVLLVDGGVYDNQGIASLFEQDCSVMLVSDASGQMDAEDNPSDGILGVPLRSSSIVQSRIRTSQYNELVSRYKSSLIKDLMFIHLKQDLEPEDISWMEQKSYDIDDSQEDEITSYGIPKEIQKNLASIRTDLDSFSDIEAYSLMFSGYKMTEKQFESHFHDFPRSNLKEIPKWDFLKIAEHITKPNEDMMYRKVLKNLKVAKNPGFKIWMLDEKLKNIGITILVIILFLFLLAAKTWSSYSVLNITLGALGITLLLLLVGFIIGKLKDKFIKKIGKSAVNAFQYRSFLRKLAIGLGTALIGSILAKIHLWYFDKKFLEQGKIE